MQAAFPRRPDTTWLREAKRIAIFEPWQVASEEDECVGAWTDSDGPARIAGTYLDQRRLADGHCMSQAEVVVPLSCSGGAYCTRHP